MNPETLKTMKESAEEARTSDQSWRVGTVNVWDDTTLECVAVTHHNRLSKVKQQAIAEFIAICNPANVSALIAERDALAASRRVHEIDNHHNALACGYCSGPLKDELLRVQSQVERQAGEIERLTKLIDTPHTDDWLHAVPLEAAHQVKRWGVEHDVGKTPLDWFWLIGYLAQKAATSALAGDAEKAKHHTVSTGAVLLNWFRRLAGDEHTFQPGIDPQQRTEAGTLD